MKDFSIILPSRGRPQLLTNFLSSIGNLAFDLNSVEVLIAIDDDDLDMHEYVNTHQFTFVKFFVVKRSLNFSRDYYTYLFTQSEGRWIITCNDDAEFMTPHWDKLAKEVLEEYTKMRHNILMGWIEDCLGVHRLSQFGNYCCFPLFGREGVEALGYIFPSDIPTWGADIWSDQLYRNVGRIVQLPIVIKHISIHNNLREPDEIYKRIASNQVSTSVNPTAQQVNTLINVLRAGRKERIYG